MNLDCVSVANMKKTAICINDTQKEKLSNVHGMK